VGISTIWLFFVKKGCRNACFSSDYLVFINLFGCFSVKRLTKRLFFKRLFGVYQPFRLFFGKKVDETPIFQAIIWCSSTFSAVFWQKG